MTWPLYTHIPLYSFKPYTLPHILTLLSWPLHPAHTFPCHPNTTPWPPPSLNNTWLWLVSQLFTWRSHIRAQVLTFDKDFAGVLRISMGRFMSLVGVWRRLCILNVKKRSWKPAWSPYGLWEMVDVGSGNVIVASLEGNYRIILCSDVFFLLFC